MSESIGNRISKYRRAKSMTQEELAEKLGVSSQAVSKWETDASCPDISLLPRLCHYLGITTDELLTGKTSGVRLIPEGERKALSELTLRIYVHSADGDVVRVNLPMSLVKAAVSLGVELGGVGSRDMLNGVAFDKILELVEQGAVGKLVEVESADGDTVEVVVE